MISAQNQKKIHLAAKLLCMRDDLIAQCPYRLDSVAENYDQAYEMDAWKEALEALDVLIMKVAP
jgi:Holliday junction resolvase-like predicted endonuclease